MDPNARFYRQFQNSVASLQEQIGQLSSFATVGGERQDAVEHILSGISRLSKDVADAADHLPAYDQRTYSEAVKALREHLNETVAKFSPKQRFQFKTRATNGAAAAAKPDTRRLNLGGPLTAEGAGSAPTSGGDSKGTSAQPAGSSGDGADGTQSGASAPRDITLSDHAQVHLRLPPTASRATSAGAVTNLQRCIVDMTPAGGYDAAAAAPFASLTLKDIAGSVIVAGQVDGPVHVTGVRDSVVMVVARQVRIHECENVAFYLHCVSRPIIEDCKDVRFARAPESFLTEKQKSEANLFDQVDDFKWLKTTTSPNWSLLPESDIIPDSAWANTRAVSPGACVDDILRGFGLGKGS